jgi:hypothetical protein
MNFMMGLCVLIDLAHNRDQWWFSVNKVMNK